MDYVGGHEGVTNSQTGERNPRLLNEHRRVMRLQHYSLRTEQAGISWIVSVHKRASLPVMDSLRKNGVLLRSHFQ